ncbi:MAG: hypothetical protein U0869_17280 [Chloroflexota bacterium]
MASLCPRCRAFLADPWVWCRFCGAGNPVAPAWLGTRDARTCVRCGHRNPARQTVCRHCHAPDPAGPWPPPRPHQVWGPSPPFPPQPARIPRLPALAPRRRSVPPSLLETFALAVALILTSGLLPGASPQDDSIPPGLGVAHDALPAPVRTRAPECAELAQRWQGGGPTLGTGALLQEVDTIDTTDWDQLIDGPAGAPGGLTDLFDRQLAAGCFDSVP